MQQVYKYKL